VDSLRSKGSGSGIGVGIWRHGSCRSDLPAMYPGGDIVEYHPFGKFTGAGNVGAGPRSTSLGRLGNRLGKIPPMKHHEEQFGVRRLVAAFDLSIAVMRKNEFES
jgi:hypothetical protein